MSYPLGKRSARFLALILGWLVLTAPSAFPWGSDAHVLITDKAVSILPDELRPLFEQHRDELRRLCNVPDNEWRKDPKLAHRSSWHYLDIDMFDYGYPFRDFPRDLDQAKALYEKVGKEAGYLPWTIRDFYQKLVEAFRAGDADAIIEQAGLLSHFAGDATMPLHATRNYNGKYSGNLYLRLPSGSPEYGDKGVHQRFELGLIQMYLDAYTREVQPEPPERIEDVLEHAFSVIMDAYWYKEHLLYFDKVICRELGIHDRQSFREKRQDYYRALHKHLGWLAVAQMEKGAHYLASLWVSAWQEAGKPKF